MESDKLGMEFRVPNKVMCVFTNRLFLVGLAKELRYGRSSVEYVIEIYNRFVRKGL